VYPRIICSFPGSALRSRRQCADRSHIAAWRRCGPKWSRNSGRTRDPLRPGDGSNSERLTGPHGEYAFEQIKPDTYTILVSAAGFSSQKQVAELLVNQARTADFKLSVAAASGETVEVVSNGSMLNVSDATVGTPFDTHQIQSLPFEGNNVLDLLSLQAGVLFLGDQTQSQMNSDSRSGAVDGARSDQTNVTLDGVDDNDQNAGYAFSGVLRSTRDSVEEFAWSRRTPTRTPADRPARRSRL